MNRLVQSILVTWQCAPKSKGIVKKTNNTFNYLYWVNNLTNTSSPEIVDFYCVRSLVLSSEWINCRLWFEVNTHSTGHSAKSQLVPSETLLLIMRLFLLWFQFWLFLTSPALNMAPGFASEKICSFRKEQCCRQTRLNCDPFCQWNDCT